MRKVLWIFFVLGSFPSFAARSYTSPPIVLAGEFNKNPATGTWPSQVVAENFAISVSNPSNIEQNISVKLIFESLVWQDFSASGVVAHPLSTHTGAGATVTANGSDSYFGGTLDSVGQYQVETGFIRLAPNGTARIEGYLHFRGPVGAPASYPHVRIRSTGTVKFTVREDKGAMMASLKVYGSNGNAGLIEDSNLAQFSPYFVPLNGARPF